MPNMTEASLNVDLAGQDTVLPFQVSSLDVRGRAVQLGPLLDTLLDRHTYPDAVSRLLAEALTLTVLLGTVLKIEGKFILQTRTNGPVSMLVADFTTPYSVRAYARYDTDAVATAEKKDAATLLGKGTLAMTIDQGDHTQRYQGIVELDGIGLEEVARCYFRQSEQIPTEIRLAVGEVYTRQHGTAPERSWSAGGVLLQFLPDTEERMRLKDLDAGDGKTENHDGFEQDDAWTEAQALMQTISDVELTDKAISSQRLLFRLFHEHDPRVFDPMPVREHCSCSREKVSGMLNGLSQREREESIEDGEIKVTCQFCSRSYSFNPSEF